MVVNSSEVLTTFVPSVVHPANIYPDLGVAVSVISSPGYTIVVAFPSTPLKLHVAVPIALSELAAVIATGENLENRAYINGSATISDVTSIVAGLASDICVRSSDAYHPKNLYPLCGFAVNSILNPSTNFVVLDIALFTSSIEGVSPSIIAEIKYKSEEAANLAVYVFVLVASKV